MSVNQYKSNLSELDISNDNINKINFVYKNAVSSLLEIDKSFDKTNTRANLLLAYLGLIIGFCVLNIINKDLSIIVKIIVSFSLILYMVILLFVVYNIIMPKLDKSPIYNYPEHLLIDFYFNKPFIMMKFFEAEKMQDRINNNWKILSEKVKDLKNAILCTFILTFVSGILIIFYDISTKVW